jgi:capsular exopolysaccharide synthesis family protein
MGKMQEALRRAEEARSRVRPTGAPAEAASAAPAAAGPSPFVTAAAATFQISASMRSGEVDPHLVALTDPRSPTAEQYRTLRTNLMALSPSQPLKVFVVTSSVPNEGKSVTSVNLAAMLAEEVGKRVVVVDADMRKPSLHKLLGIDNQRGLADYLAGGTMLEMVVQRSFLSNLWILPSGRIPPNPSELLGGKRMDDLVARLRRDYDYVIVDTPPVVSTTDAGVLSPRVDGTVLVVRMERTPREVARHAVELLKKARANLVGTVLTGLEGTQDPYSYPYISRSSD